MNLNELNALWKNALYDLLKVNFDNDVISVLSHQTIDSIRRISIYEAYAIKARRAEQLNLPFIDTSNPFTLSQRSSLEVDSKVWYIYLATYFGKSNKSKWKLFNKAVFRKDRTLIRLKEIQTNREKYYSYLKDIDFFEGANFSNHRKYTKKALEGHNGLINSIDYFLDNLDHYSHSKLVEFDLIFRNAMRIPNFGRMAAFDFTSSLCKCNLNVKDPISMYHHSSTGPLRALKDILILADCKDVSKSAQVEFGNNLLDWFIRHFNTQVVAQVLEDAICNWQKSPKKYQRYFG